MKGFSGAGKAYEIQKVPGVIVPFTFRLLPQKDCLKNGKIMITLKVLNFQVQDEINAAYTVRNQRLQELWR